MEAEHARAAAMPAAKPAWPPAAPSATRGYPAETQEPHSSTAARRSGSLSNLRFEFVPGEGPGNRVPMTDDDEYLCVLCASTFTAYSTFVDHELAHMTGSVRYNCLSCDLGFKTTQSLRVHAQTKQHWIGGMFYSPHDDTRPGFKIRPFTRPSNASLSGGNAATAEPAALGTTAKGAGPKLGAPHFTAPSLAEARLMNETGLGVQEVRGGLDIEHAMLGTTWQPTLQPPHLV